jgi:hypothetical protein
LLPPYFYVVANPNYWFLADIIFTAIAKINCLGLSRLSLCCYSVSSYSSLTEKLPFGSSYQLYQNLSQFPKVNDDIINLMATGQSLNLDLPYPLESDQVNVHGDIKTLVDRLDIILPSASYVEIPVVNTHSSTLAAGTPVYITGHDGTNVQVDVFVPTTAHPVLGLLKSSTAHNAVGVVVITGIISGIATSSYTAGDVLYVSDSGGLTKTMPSGGSPAIATVAYSSANNGILIIGTKGSPTWGSIKSGL